MTKYLREIRKGLFWLIVSEVSAPGHLVSLLLNQKGMVEESSYLMTARKERQRRWGRERKSQGQDMSSQCRP
jgi:hypothetical protein